MELMKLQSKKDGKTYQGFVYRNKNKDWMFRKYEEPYGWQDSFLTYYKPIENEQMKADAEKQEVEVIA